MIITETRDTLPRGFEGIRPSMKHARRLLRASGHDDRPTKLTETTTTTNLAARLCEQRVSRSSRIPLNGVQVRV